MGWSSQSEELVRFALEIAREAEKEILPVFARDFDVEMKADHSPVTEADRAAEKRLRAMIEARYPEHAVLGEEFGESGRQGSSHRWILDPIDGTVSFTCRVPLFGTLVALEVEGETVLGVAHFPGLGQSAWGSKGGGAFLDGKPIQVRRCERLADALLCTTGFHMTELGGVGEGEARYSVAPLLRKVRQFRGWGDCYGHVLVASGRADAMVDPAMKPWDNAALLPILREAGASVFSIEGREDDLVNAGSLVSCAAGLRDPLRDALRAG